MEWNGMEHFHKLEKMFLQFSIKPLISIENVIYVADEENHKVRIADAGEIALSQIASSDCSFIRTEKNKVSLPFQSRRFIYTSGHWNRFIKRIFHYKIKPHTWFFFAVISAVLYWAIEPALVSFGFSADRFFTLFLGVFLQAVPFLTIGVLLSSAIQVYVPQGWIQKKFPTNVVAGQLFAILAGFCIPVCDCASIPVFKSLIKKGVPLSAAITFMLVSPVINPVVILSTWYAFNGKWSMIAARCGLGIVCAVLVGLSFLIGSPNKILTADLSNQLGTCQADDFLSEKPGETSRFTLFMNHAQSEFFTVGKYLVIGIIVSVFFQDLIPVISRTEEGISLVGSILLMMGLAFLLSLCSSSDAVVARTMAGTFPVGVLMGFLVFGPMMDIKNTAMLISSFRKRFVVRLMGTTAIVCFLIVLLFAGLGSGGIRI
jgi:hypothetical protein